ncbi:hypothetical protein MTR_4g129260 [Medicago truncatula]|uniref:Uncharacterized protein n=1 Tax=Medicago truncatula TaxID=3880 RepID=G7JE99_MEDTR|nr:hypothetical protein MTR_4g129260 [Medicago truncatula]
MEEDLVGSYKKLKTLNTKNPKGSNKRKNVLDLREIGDSKSCFDDLHGNLTFDHEIG